MPKDGNPTTPSQRPDAHPSPGGYTGGPASAKANTGGSPGPAKDPALGREGGPAGAVPPPFLERLAAAGRDLTVTKEGPCAWRLDAPGIRPVWVIRHEPGNPARASGLSEISGIASRWAGARLCLSPRGGLDLFFDDNGSFEAALEALRKISPGSGPAAAEACPGDAWPEDIPEDPARHGGACGIPGAGGRGAPVSLSRCRGLGFCPNAAVDTKGLSGLLEAVLQEVCGPGGARMSVSLHGCPAGCGFDCGVWEYTDLRLIGRRSGTPVIDQWLLALSPEPGALARLCPAGALRLSDAPDRILDLDGTLCLRCGACLAADPSFSWPSPQGSYLALELSGRKAAAPRGYLAPRLLVRREDDAERLFRKIASLAAIFLERARGGEILGDFMAREGLMGFFGEGGADGD